VGGLVALTLGAAPGCSVLVVDGPPPEDVRPRPDFVCTTSKVVPVADLVASAAVAAHELGDVGNPDRDWTGLRLSQDHRYILTAVIATAFYASALWGHELVRACREATAAADARQVAIAPRP
jgi:hypothetical protein